MVTSALKVPAAVHAVSHINNFRQQTNGKDQNETHFFSLGTKSGKIEM